MQYNFRLSNVQDYPFKLNCLCSIKYRWYQKAWHQLVCYWNTDFPLPPLIFLNAKEVQEIVLSTPSLVFFMPRLLNPEFGTLQIYPPCTAAL